MVATRTSSGGFYSVRDVARLSEIPLRTLYDWQQKGIIAPALEVEGENGRVEEGYTYAQLTIIRIIRSVRDRRLDFAAAAVALDHLYDRLGAPTKGWAGERVYVVGSRIYADRPDEWEITAATEGGQKLEVRLFGDYFDELREIHAGESILVPPEFRKHVHIDPDVMGGEPVVKGTRVPTRLLASLSRAGNSVAELVRAYRIKSREFVESAIAYEKRLDAASSRA